MQKGVLTQQRLAVLLGTKIFDRVRKEKEEVRENEYEAVGEYEGEGGCQEGEGGGEYEWLPHVTWLWP